MTSALRTPALEALRFLAGEHSDRSRRDRALFFAAHACLFLLFVMLLYRACPGFLVQSHDGQNLYFMADKLWIWRASWLDSLTFTPLEASGGTIWPLNPSFIPFLWPFTLTGSPTMRVYGLSVLASLTIFCASLVFYAALRVQPRIAVAAAWMTFVVFMLQTADFMSGTDPLISISLAYLALAAFTRIGSGSPMRNSIFAIAFVATITMQVLAHPSWHLISLPFLCFAVIVLTACARTRAEVGCKFLAVVAAATLHAALGTYPALLLLVGDTARVMEAQRFVPYAQTPYLAGHLFRSSLTEVLWGTLMIVGLFAGNLRQRDQQLGARTALALLTGGIYAGAAVGGLWFIYSGITWPLPKPSYLMLFAYPLSALFTVIGALYVVRVGTPRAMALRRPAIMLTLLGVFLAWHIFTANLWNLMWAVGLCAVLLLWGVARRWPGLAVLIAIPPLLIAFQLNVASLVGGAPDKRSSGLLRMGLVTTPVVRFLESNTALRPGSTFRGYVDDVYRRRPAERDLNEEFVNHWALSWIAYGTGHKAFSWSLFDIPVLTQYSPYIKPLFFDLFAATLNEPTDRHVVNYLTITHPDERILRMLGVRYLVTDTATAPVSPAQMVFAWDKFKVFELSRPNLGNFSPSTLELKTDVDAAIRALRDPGFDPEHVAIVHASVSTEILQTAMESELRFERGGYSVRARSPGSSLLVLPVQFSHCFRVRVIEGDARARLIRVNLVQTGLLFHEAVRLEARFRHWPRASPECQRLDRDDATALQALRHHAVRDEH